MRTHEKRNTLVLLLLVISLCTISSAAFADDKDSAAPAQPRAAAGNSVAPKNTDAVATGLTERERMLLDRVEQLERRVEELEASGKASATPTAAAPSAAAAPPTPSSVSAPSAAAKTATAAAAVSGTPASVPGAPAAMSAAATQAAKAQPVEPFSDWDWTWLNGNPRTKNIYWDTPFFTPEIRVDTNYVADFNHPTDHTIGGSSELFRSSEVQLEQLGVGGDFHYDNVRARLMTQFGMYSATTPRNDPSPGHGQWDLVSAYRYLSEAYGGYHFNVLQGVNVDAGIFLSYIGLFSYYNFDNWAYQPSYVSSNTPWFFNGVRVQIFPTKHLKIEPWFINGWQAYASANHRPGLGGQIKWTPTSWINIISNNYGLGQDDLFVPGRKRIHTDDSIEIKYFDRPGRTIDKMAFSFTGDMGCEFGPSKTTSAGVYLQGVGCLGNTKDAKSVGGDFFKPGINPKQSFIGYMFYDRTWFSRDRFALTLGGGQINNPGRYLVLVPPINGETAPSAAINSPYFAGNPSDPFKAWDSSITFDYMPSQYVTFRWEYDYRHASVPYWSGAGGVTPPGSGGVPYTNNGYPQFFASNDGNSSMQETLSAAQTACGAQGSSVWFPDLRRDEQFIDMAIMVKF